ncbi:tRNA (adenosine(37)-N6)-threonylcarbamoyltransferase complex dimerization subunit type 1 TsaB [Microvirgula aerodenitrificans]|uniref:tRNA (Adenosine(37)-N6)-threonylcarbamoyltransferase complex dimerization subunit type 1 TsaB n=1 Tax=Microvirgula aerodenitrificans TaxID=57480 RepID=A0A2S0P775_9NEIS|nr:tRNA (adenosine(37)-N6)-threonylcarbamoyltransferase complex dimerization subunit type 1 TsaB [Microvirgula aerodenitrificans]AVY93264.1 tRNA (adenosine(37)-N6)-threonylcarbamoyltransferase complex dimerization subunit type 1 TsaB [Microvirgula aerodenitrificans]
MNLIALDTSTEYLSIAVRFDGVVHAHHSHVGQKHAEATLPQLAELLAEAGRPLADVDAIVFGQGPGSFTGLRIGCGLAQGLAFSCAKSLIGIPTLDALAATVDTPCVLACLDARMGEVYAAGYDRRDGSQPIPMGLYAPDALPVIDGMRWVGAGSGFDAHAEALASRLGNTLAAVEPGRQPSALAMLALADSGRYPLVPPERAELLYLRNKVALTTREREAR